MVGGEFSDEMHPLPVPSFPLSRSFGTLIAIPLEIRLKIYRALVERGQVAILRTSQAISEEAFDKFYKHAVCRLDFNCNLSVGAYPIRVPWSSIQNLELRVKITNDRNTPSMVYFNKWLQRFSVFMRSLKVCSIRLDFPRAFWPLPETFTAIKTLTAVPKITFAIAVNTKTFRMTPNLVYIDGRRPDMDRNMYLDMHCEFDKDDILAYEWAAGVLEQTLGRAEWFGDLRGLHLEFHPQKNAIPST